MGRIFAGFRYPLTLGDSGLATSEGGVKGLLQREVGREGRKEGVKEGTKEAGRE